MAELPLQLAALELRFPGDPAVEAARGDFFQRVRAEFPEVYVPLAELGQAPALQAYQFSASGQRRSLNVALNSFAYVVSGSEYGSFETFRASFRRYFELFRLAYPHLPGLTRIGLRYVNHLPLERSGLGFIDASPLRLPSISESPRRNFALVSESLEGIGLQRVYINTNEPLPAPAQWPPNKVLLDFDYALEGSVYQLIPLDSLEEYAQVAHDVTKHLFRNLVDSSYLEEVGIK